MDLKYDANDPVCEQKQTMDVEDVWRAKGEGTGREGAGAGVSRCKLSRIEWRETGPGLHGTENYIHTL